MIKDKKRAKEKNKKLEKNQIRLNRILGLLGVTDLHKTLSRSMREYLVNNPDPPLVVEYTGSQPIPDETMQVIDLWRTATYKGVSSDDFIEVLRPLLRVIHGGLNHNGLATANEVGSYKIDREFIDAYWNPAQEYLDYFQGEFRNLLSFLNWYGTFVDTRYVKSYLEWFDASNFRVRTKIKVRAFQAQSSHFAGRWNYRVGCQMKSVTGVSKDGVQWLSQSPVALGLPGREDERLPVYISGHAVARMRERLDCFEPQVLITPCIYISMAEPGVHPLKYDGDGADSLVEFRVMSTGVKAGYFVVSRTENEIYIKTFLFLTLPSTPEGNLLHKRLRMARLDCDFHQLDRYSTFRNTDIATHPALVPIWEECGFTQFLEWVRRGHNPEEIQSMGDDMAKYFRLPSPGVGA